MKKTEHLSIFVAEPDDMDDDSADTEPDTKYEDRLFADAESA